MPFCCVPEQRLELLGDRPARLAVDHLALACADADRAYRVRLAHEDSFFKVVDLERGRMGARKDGAGTRRFEVQISEEKARTDELYKAMTALLLELNNRALRRKGVQQEAQWRENGLRDVPGGIAARIAEAIRGART
jgi:hypothetical protein